MSDRPLDSTGLKRLHRDWRRRTTGRLGLVLDGVQGPYNVGSILRTAAALSVDHVWFGGQCAPATGGKTDKTALGSQRFLTWSEHPRGVDAVTAAADAGFRVVGIELSEQARPLHDLDLAGDVCVVLGNEDHGISRDALSACSAVAYLPQTGRIGSLNVATAASIALYEVRRAGWASPS